MAIIHEAHFESNDFSEWSSTALTADITTVAPGLNSTLFKCQLTYDPSLGPVHAFESMSALFDTDTASEIRCGCRWQPDGLMFSAPVPDFGFYEIESAPNALFQIQVTDGGGGTYDITADIGEDGGSTTLTANVGVADGSENTVEVHIIKGSSSGANDGEAYLYVNGSLEASNTTLDIFDVFNDADAVGRRYRIFPQNIFGKADPGGGVNIDDVIFRDDSTQIFPVAATSNQYTAATIPKPMDISRDGANLYIAALDSLTEPVLIKMSTALNVDGNVVFQPGAGDNIGVQCSKGDADEVTVAGQFDGTNVVERSEDAGSTFSVIDDTTIGGVASFIVGPDSDNRIMVFDEDNFDILETIDEGSSWTSNNASVSQVLRVLARLGIDVNQLIAGTSSADSAQVLHSPNAGAELEDIELDAFGLPNRDINGVIIN